MRAKWCRPASALLSALFKVLQINSLCEEINTIAVPCTDPEGYVRGGPTLTTFLFWLMRGSKYRYTISGTSSARQRNAI